ncbi:MAG: HEAT repeat domain-containing protein [Candidatus Acidiferrum sp.]
MRYLLALLFTFLTLQSPDAFPPLGIIDFYGLRTVPEARLREALPYHMGDSIQIDQFKSQKHAVEQKLASIPGVDGAFLTLVCCTQDRKSILYVGIEEPSTPCQKFQPAPTGSVRLTEDVPSAGSDYDIAFHKSILKGNFAEDDSQGHSLDLDPDVRAIQLRFVDLADAHLANLKEVLRNSSDGQQRAWAAQVLGYVKDKQAIVPGLVAAMRDPDPDVRNNATRALLVFAEFSPKPPAHKINISPKPFIEMLNSCAWSDRNKSSGALAQLTEKRDPALLTEIRNQALPSLVEMATWKNLGHAWYSLMILGRIGGLTDDEIQKDLDQGNRASVIAAAQEVANHKN